MLFGDVTVTSSHRKNAKEARIVALRKFWRYANLEMTLMSDVIFLFGAILKVYIISRNQLFLLI